MKLTGICGTIQPYPVLVDLVSELHFRRPRLFRGSAFRQRHILKTVRSDVYPVILMLRLISVTTFGSRSFGRDLEERPED